jgi:molecular chaperone DnaK
VTADSVFGINNITLHFSSLTSESEETVAGIIEDLRNSPEEYYLQIQSDSGHFTSSKLRLENGKFFETVPLLPRQTNLFWIYLFDRNGSPQPVRPESFSITHGLSVSGAPIPHTIGIAVMKRDAKNRFELKEIFEPFFQKGDILPLKSEFRVFHTLKLLRKGEENFLPIKVYEGESEIPDRNAFICDIRINGKDLPYDLPENTDVEIQVEVNESREVRVKAYIPTLDLSLDGRGSILSETIDQLQVSREFATQSDRARKIEADCTLDERLQLGRMLSSIDGCLKGAGTDEDEKRKAYKELKDLKVFLDQLEGEKELSQLEKDFRRRLSEIEQFIRQIGTEDQQARNLEQLNKLKAEGEKAVEKGDKFILIRVNEQILDLGRKILWSDPNYWIYQFHALEQDPGKFMDQREANYYLGKGKRAIELRNIDELRDCVVRLMALLPPEEQRAAKTTLSGITY